MLEIDDKTMKQIAQMPEVEHSWLAPMITKSQNLEELDHQLAEWMLEKMYPRKEATDLNQEEYNVWRIVRTMFPLLLENEAIAAFLNQSPKWIDYLQEVNSPSEAAEIGAMDVMYVPQEQVSEAAEWLGKLNNGTLMPDKTILQSQQQEVMPPSQPASSDSQS